MRIIIAGATGFVGSNIARKLLVRGHAVSPIIRPGTKSKIQIGGNFAPVSIDPLNPIDISATDSDIVINAIGIIREFPSKGITFRKIHYEITKNLVDFARGNSIPRFIQISALGVGPEGKTAYQKSKFEGEEYLRNSGLDWTIIRPSMIVGHGDHVTAMFSRMVRLLPVVPVIGDGDYRLQPVHIDDICEGIANAVSSEQAINRLFETGGPEALTFNDILNEIGKAYGKRRVRKFHQPVAMMRLLAAIFGRFAWFPLTGEQITMLLEDNFTDDNSFFDLFEIKPKKFGEFLKDFAVE